MVDPTILLMVLVFSLPTLAILTRPVTQWLKLRAAKDGELNQKVARLERANADYAQRLENLEAVVVSQIKDPGLLETDRQRRFAAVGPHEVNAPAAEEINPQRVAHLARRLGG